MIKAPRGTPTLFLLLLLSRCSFMQAQERRLFVVQPPATVIEYDPQSFAKKDTRPVPAEVPSAPQVLQINHHGQMLFAPSADDPSPDVGKGALTFWLWDGRSELKLGRDAIRTSSKLGSNQKVTESNPQPFLSADGTHLFWFSNQFVKLQRDNIELSVTTSVNVWRSDLSGRQRQDLASSELPECRCTTGSCQETCPEAAFWAPESGIDNFFLLTQFTPGQTEVKYLASSVYKGSGDTWTASQLPQPLHRVLDAADGGSVIIDAIPDIGCCGWENQSNDQTFLFSYGKKSILFDERQQFNNPDYDISFFTSNAKLSPQLTSVAMTVVASSKSNLPIQLSEDGQGNPAESQRIRKVLTQLPEVQVVSATEPGKRTALVPHATLVGWLSEKEILIVENHVLVAYNIASGARSKSEIKIADATSAFIR